MAKFNMSSPFANTSTPTFFHFLLPSKILITFMLLLTAQLSHAESSVWKVSKGNSHVYLGGTMHLLEASDHPLPSEYDLAYKDSDTLVFEADSAALSSPAFSTKMMQALMFNDGRTLKSVLKPSTYAQFEAFTQQQGIPSAQLNAFTPSGVTLMITVMEFTRRGYRPDLGVDHTYSEKSLKDNKKQMYLETPDEQLAFIANLAKGKEDEMVLYTINQFKDFDKIVGEMKKAWRTGDMKTFEGLAIEELKNEFPNAYKSLLSDRNNNWVRQIEPMFNNKKGTEFILIGALHLAGEEGLLQQFKSRGYRVEKL